MIGVAFNNCQGWFYRAQGHRGVLLVGGHGFEDLCTRRTCAALSERLAHAGMPVLRYDFPGCGDSLGSDSVPGLVEQMRKSVGAGAKWLQQNANVSEIIVIGLRLGGLLAALELDSVPGLTWLALLAAPASGRQYVREMKVLSKIMRPPLSDTSQKSLDSNDINVCGFLISEETQADLANLALTVSSKSQPHVLVLGQNTASTQSAAKLFATAGCTTEAHEFTGYDAMICDPTASRIPHASLDRIVDWASKLSPLQFRNHPPHIAPTALIGPTWTESAVCFGPENKLCGILCEPTIATHSSAQPIIFLNSGMSYHIGWARMTVRHARTLAQSGIPSLRFDVAGIGDSGVPIGTEVDAMPLYTARAEEDLSAAIDWMEQQGQTSPLVVGACSGAYTAFHGARKDKRISGCIAVNLQCFTWEPSMGFEIERWRDLRKHDLTAQRVSQDDVLPFSVRLKAQLKSTALRAMRPLVRLAKRVLRRQQQSASGASVFSQSMLWINALAMRNARMMFVYSRGDSGLAALEHEVGPNAHLLSNLPNASLHFIENADHNLTQREAQDDLLRLIFEASLGSTADQPNSSEVLHRDPDRSAEAEALRLKATA